MMPNGGAGPAARSIARSAVLLMAAVSLLAAGCAGRPGAFDPDSIPEAYRRPTGALMWPGATRAFLVTPEGGLENGEWRVVFDASAGGVGAGPPRAIAAEDRWLPVLHWTRRAGSVRFAFEAAAVGSPRDSNLIVSLQVAIENTGAEPHAVRLAVRLVHADSAPAFTAWDAPTRPEAPPLWAAGSSTQRVHAWTDADAGNGADREARWTLRPGELRRVRVALPAYPMESAALHTWTRAPHRVRAGETRRYWTGLLGEGIQVQLGDPEVEHAFAAARVVLLACRERRGERWLPIGGPFHYRDVWLRDGARAIQALALCGHTRTARELARGFLSFQWPQGAFLSQRGQLDGTGQAMWAMDQALMRGAPDDSVARFATAALEAWRWLEWQRQMGRESGTPFGPMMPYAEPNDAELTRAQLVGNDAWAIAGYRAAARLLRAGGETAAAAAVEDSLAGYLTDFARALGRTGHADLPPAWQPVGRDWGNLAAGYPCQVFPPRHPRLMALADRVWATSGGTGLTWYGTRDSLQYYVGADLGTWALLAGREAQADSVLDALLRWRTASGGAGELFTRDGEFGANLPPHTTAAAALITLVRNSLVFDDDDTLRLTLGARDSWWNGSHVKRAPTRWGILDLEFRRKGDDAEWRWTPVSAWTALTLPPGTRLAGTPVPPLQAGASEREVLAPPGTRHAQVTLAGGGL